MMKRSLKSKLILNYSLALIISLIVSTILYLYIAKNQYIETLKEQLAVNNNMINVIFKNDTGFLTDENLKNSFTSQNIRVTCIDNNGEVKYDSEKANETLENHNDRDEVKQAKLYGSGKSIRYSYTLKKQMLYIATSYNNEYVIRSAIPINSIKFFTRAHVQYYILVLIFTFAISTFIVSRVALNLTKPINELQKVTSEIAKGQLHKRATVITKDEVGELAKTFNVMAENLNTSIEDSFDKRMKLEAILNSMENGVIAIDNNNKILIINPYAQKLFGLREENIGDLLNHHIRDFELIDILKDSNEEYSELKIFYPYERILRIKTTYISNNNGIRLGIVAVIQDITQMRSFENMRSDFVANVTHELKTPLTSIKGFAETLKYVEDKEKKDKFLDIIYEESERLTRLINDILTLSSIEQKQHKKINTYTNFEPEKIIDEVIELIIIEAKKKQIVIEKNIISSKVLNGDVDGFKQIILNLMDNAIKYSDNNSSIKITTEKLNNILYIEVEDSGIGIPKKDIPRLFERFYRVDKARSRQSGGTGLGLSIVKHMVMLFNGKISVDSEVGKGTKFKIWI